MFAPMNQDPFPSMSSGSLPRMTPQNLATASGSRQGIRNQSDARCVRGTPGSRFCRTFETSPSTTTDARRCGRPPAASRRARLGASDPPRSRSAARRRCALRVAPELSDPLGTVEVGEHEDVKELGREPGPRGIIQKWRNPRGEGSASGVPVPVLSRVRRRRTGAPRPRNRFK
jgi:hypothetical protein